MTRSTTPPPAPPSDVARLRVALWKIAGHIGIDLDSSMGDHQIAELIEHRLGSSLSTDTRTVLLLGERRDGQTET